MHVDALFFASYRDLVGTEQLRVDLPEPSAVGDLIAKLRARGSPFDRLPESPAVAVNEVYARADAALSDGDEVAFIPPVAGG